MAKKKPKHSGFDPLHIAGLFEDVRDPVVNFFKGQSAQQTEDKAISGYNQKLTSGQAQQFDPTSALGIYDLSQVNGGPQAIISYLQQTNPSALKDEKSFHSAAQALGLQPSFMAQPKTNMPDPLTMAMIYQSTIQPFMQNILTDSRQQTQHYQDTMNQKLGSMNLAPNVKSYFEGAVPGQVARMNTGNDALAAAMAAQPGFDSFLQGLQGIQKEQNKLAAGQQQASLGGIASLFGGKVPGQ